MGTSDTTMTPDEHNDVDVICEEKRNDENFENIVKDMVEMGDVGGVLALINKVRATSTGVDLDAEGAEGCGDIENGLLIEMAVMDVDETPKVPKQVNVSEPDLLGYQESTKL